MTVSIANPFLKTQRVRTCFEHHLIIVGLKKCRMALFKVLHYMLTGPPDIGKHTNIDIIARDDKAMRIAGIMKLGEGNHSKSPYLDRLISLEVNSILGFEVKPSILQRVAPLERKPAWAPR